MSSSTKKRKHQILDSDESDSETMPRSTISDVEMDAKSGKLSTKRKKRILLLSSDEDDNNNDGISINDIKKKAKQKAKKLREFSDDETTTKSSKPKAKTPPSATKQNNLFNYFKRIEPSKSFEKVEKDAKLEPIKSDKKSEKDDKNESVKTQKEEKFTLLKSSSRKFDSNEFVATTVGNKPDLDHKPIKHENKVAKQNLAPTLQPTIKQPALPPLVEVKRISDLWVDKYKPATFRDVIGQHGDRSPLNKLIKWLRNWYDNIDKKPAYGGKWGSDDGAGFKAALLSGPPGIGKTTTAQLVCKELGYDYLELNASDSRNKKSLQEDVRELLMNTKLTSVFQRKSENQPKLTNRHCLIMDEVDGMSGNEDRGGLQELIQLIKNTKVPIICICNDRGDQKMRTLTNYCFDLRFYKPKLEQIKGALMKIAFRENIDIKPDVLNDLIISSNYDIRQCIHNLSMLAAGPNLVNNMINSTESHKPIKDVKLTPFEAIKKVFCTGEEYARMSFDDKSDLFFCDYSIMPLFVYENYHSINLSSKQPSTAKQLKRLSKTINAISFSDLVEKEIRTNQNWTLLPLQAVLSSIMPGAYMRSNQGLGFPSFPQYMGKLSTTNKNHRLVDELVSHMTLSISGTRTSFALDYLQPLRDSLVKPLIESGKGGVDAVLGLMENYSLTKDNMDSILELSLWPDDTDPLKNLDAQTKRALTNAYKKKDFSLPYATANDTREVAKKGSKVGKGKKDKNKSKAESQSESGEESNDDYEEPDAFDLY